MGMLEKALTGVDSKKTDKGGFCGMRLAVGILLHWETQEEMQGEAMERS